MDARSSFRKTSTYALKLSSLVRRLLISNIDSSFITYFSPETVASDFVDEMTEALEQLKRKVASLKKESEELQRYKKEIDWLKTLQKKLVKDDFD